MSLKDNAWLVDTFLERNYGDVEENVDISTFSYWGIGGHISAIFYPNNIEGLVFLRKNLTKININHILIGKTSNILFTSSAISGVFVCLSRFLGGCQIEGDFVDVWGGASVPWLAYKIGCKGLSGIEHTVGIPGTIGGLAYMNGGSLRKAIGNNIETVTVIDTDANVKVINNIDCNFSYRHSIFQDRNDWIISVKLKLSKSSTKLIKSEMLQILRTRRKKFPLNLPSCGSVFKSNTAAYEQVGPPGLIIEKLALKGKVVGGARISSEHANFIVNYNGKATSKDVASLVNTIQKETKRVFGLNLETEAKYLDKNCQLHCLSEYIATNGIDI